MSVKCVLMPLSKTATYARATTPGVVCEAMSLPECPYWNVVLDGAAVTIASPQYALLSVKRIVTMSPGRKPWALAVVIVTSCDAFCVFVIATPAYAGLLVRFVGARKLKPCTVLFPNALELVRLPTC